jgi:DNA-binding XRE family transcriptional regulator
MTPRVGRPRTKGKLHALIRKATKHDRQDEFAALLGVSRHAIYQWDKGTPPNPYWQTQLNALCRRYNLKLIYKVKDLSVQKGTRKRVNGKR